MGNIRTETIIGHYFCNMRNFWKAGPDSWTITIEQNAQLQVGIYEKYFNLIKFEMPDMRSLPIENFLVNVIYSKKKNLYRFKIYTIYPFH